MRVTCEPGSPVCRMRLWPDCREQVVASAGGLRELARLVAAADADPSCRIVAIEAGDGGFCHGMDLEAIAGADAEAREAGIRAYLDCLRVLRACGKVLVCLVDGMALGAGVGLAASADVVIATERSRFGLPELVLGLVPAIVLSALLDRMSLHQARRLALSGASVPACQAERDGLVDQVVPIGGLEPALRALAREVRRTRPDAVSRWKELCRSVGSAGFDRALDLGASCTRELLGDDQLRADVAAFAAGGALPAHAVEERGARP